MVYIGTIGNFLWRHLALTHLHLDKMAAILAVDNFKYIFLNDNDLILIRISLKFVSFPGAQLVLSQYWFR